MDAMSPRRKQVPFDVIATGSLTGVKRARGPLGRLKDLLVGQRPHRGASGGTALVAEFHQDHHGLFPGGRQEKVPRDETNDEDGQSRMNATALSRHTARFRKLPVPGSGIMTETPIQRQWYCTATTVANHRV
jgi:hypothetical protein